jgi:SAM-dependent methyltransferase
MARRGWRLTCLEPDAQMAALLRAKGVAEVVISDLEAWDGTPGAFDAVAAVDSWHWLDPEVAAGKVAGLLRPGGWVLVCWNRPDINRSPLSEPIHEVYAREAPSLLSSYENRTAELHPNGPASAQLAATGAFAEPEELRHVWERTYTTREYVTLLGTHSGHRLLPEDARIGLHTGAAAVIDAAGGTITIPYHAVALIAQRR